MEVKEESFTNLEAFCDLLSKSEYNYVKSTILRQKYNQQLQHTNSQTSYQRSQEARRAWRV